MFVDYAAGFYQALVALPDLVAAVPIDRIKEVVGDDKAFPYIWIDPGTTTDNSTKTSVGQEAMVSLHVASRDTGNNELDIISDFINTGLNFQPMDFGPGVQCILCMLDGTTNSIDPDGVTRRRILRFKLLVDKED